MCAEKKNCKKRLCISKKRQIIYIYLWTSTKKLTLNTAVTISLLSAALIPTMSSAASESYPAYSVCKRSESGTYVVNKQIVDDNVPDAYLSCAISNPVGKNAS